MIFWIPTALIIGVLAMGIAGVHIILENIGIILLVLAVLVLMFVGLAKWTKGTLIIIGCIFVFSICLLIGINIKKDYEAIANAPKIQSGNVSIAVSTYYPKAGDTVSLAATVTGDGSKITDLEAKELRLWWWTDVWGEDHGDGLTDSVFSNYDDNSGLSLSADVTLPSAGTYYICAELKTENGKLIAKEFIEFHVTEK